MDHYSGGRTDHMYYGTVPAIKCCRIILVTLKQRNNVGKRGDNFLKILRKRS